MGIANIVGALTSGSGVLVGVEGQFIFGFKIEGLGNFLGESGTITSFVMEEKIGGDVPAFELKFKTSDADVIKNLNEGAEMYVLFGQSLFGKYKTAEMTIQKFSNQVSADSEYVHIQISGLLKNGVEWLRENKQEAYKMKSSLHVLKDIAGRYFNVFDDMLSIDDTKDQMNWLRPNRSPSRFIDDVWKRSYISDDNALVYGIEMTGTFVITDIIGIMEQAGTIPPWRLEPYGTTEVRPFSASYNPAIEVNSEFGLMNNMTTNKKVTPIHSITDGAAKKVETPELKPSLISGPLNIMKDAPIKYEVQLPIDTTNVSDNYSKSRLINLPKNAMINSVEIDVEIENKWMDYLLFDLVDFVPYDPSVNMISGSLNSTLGGTYTITKISRYFANNRAVIKLTLSRDGMNGMSGTLGWSGASLLNLF